MQAPGWIYGLNAEALAGWIVVGFIALAGMLKLKSIISFVLEKLYDVFIQLNPGI